MRTNHFYAILNIKRILSYESTGYTMHIATPVTHLGSKFYKFSINQMEVEEFLRDFFFIIAIIEIYRSILFIQHLLSDISSFSNDPRKQQYYNSLCFYANVI